MSDPSSPPEKQPSGPPTKQPSSPPAKQPSGTQKKKPSRQQSIILNVARTPVLLPSPYGPAKNKADMWAMDLLALPHNAVRIELDDMYKIYTSMKKRTLDIAKEDFDEFYKWWPFFFKLTHTIFDVQDQLLYPWAEQKGDLPGRVGKTRNIFKKALIDSLSSIKAMQSEYTSASDMEEFLQKFCKALDEFTLKILDYFKDMEEVMPKAISEFIPESKRTASEKKIVTTIKASMKEYPEVMFCLARGIQKDVPDQTAWVSKYAGFMKKLTGGIHAWNDSYVAHHNIVNHFTTTLDEYIKKYGGNNETPA